MFSIFTPALPKEKKKLILLSMEKYLIFIA